MKIDRIDVIRVLNPFRHPFETSFTRFVNRDALLIKIYSEGLAGWGGVQVLLRTVLQFRGQWHCASRTERPHCAPYSSHRCGKSGIIHAVCTDDPGQPPGQIRC